MVVLESEAHWRVFDRLNKGNDYRMVVTASCEDRSGRRRLKTRKKEFVIMTWMRFWLFSKRMTLTVEELCWGRTAEDVADQRVYEG